MIYLVYMYKQDLALNKCTMVDIPPNQTKSGVPIMSYLDCL